MFKNKKLKMIIFACLTLVLGLLTFNFKVSAKYPKCDIKIKDSEYYSCGDRVYTYPEDTRHSSYITSSKGDVVYAGEKNGYSLFYVNEFKFHNYTYDDRTPSNNNIWTIIYSEGEVIFDGSFKDSWIVDETHQGDYRHRLNNKTYTIEQYNNNGSLVRKFIIYNSTPEAYEYNELKFYNINDVNLNYDGSELNSKEVNEVVKVKDRVLINFKSEFGIKELALTINDNESYIKNNISTPWDITEYIKSHLIKGESNRLNIYLVNYLGKEIELVYDLFYLGNDVHISFETISSNVVSSSRRILVNAQAGIGKKLDMDYCWYYWSENPDDELTEDSFLRNYAKSEYKGSYSKDKGVILRNTSGTYYLYALAKDDDSSLVTRSEGYILDNSYSIDYNLNDFIFILALLNICVLPVLIYVFIKKRGY